MDKIAIKRQNFNKKIACYTQYMILHGLCLCHSSMPLNALAQARRHQVKSGGLGVEKSEGDREVKKTVIF